MERLMLFCIPYAGGSAMIYNRWKGLLDERIELVPLELAGRGKRYQEPFHHSFSEALEDLYSQTEEFLDGGPYAIFGHSMGSLLAFELAHRLQSAKAIPPLHHLFLSGRDAPNYSVSQNKQYSDLPDEQLIAIIKELGIAAPEIFQNPAILNIFLPVLRADFRIVEDYRFVDKPEPLDTNITVIYGDTDPIIEHDMNEWARFTRRDFRMASFPGGHFLIHQHTEAIVELIRDALFPAR
jgi:surfactin synthase thioesterase subunit